MSNYLSWPTPSHNPSPIAHKNLGTYWRVKWAVLREMSRLTGRQRRRDREDSPLIDLGGEG